MVIEMATVMVTDPGDFLQGSRNQEMLPLHLTREKVEHLQISSMRDLSRKTETGRPKLNSTRRVCPIWGAPRKT